MTHFDQIRQWAADRNLIEGATPQAQFVKLMEEAGELAAGIAKSRQDAVVDGIGDMVVVLTILAAQHGVTIEDCIATAYNEIKDRKGRMVNGCFVKEADLPINPATGEPYFTIPTQGWTAGPTAANNEWVEVNGCFVKDADLPKDEWIEWKGGKNYPTAPENVVAVRLRGGSEGSRRACSLDWSIDGGPGDIVAYQVVQP